VPHAHRPPPSTRRRRGREHGDLPHPGRLRPARRRTRAPVDDGSQEIAKRIEAAREEGDLKENGGYHAAKDEQGKQEARIRTLQALLKDAVVGEAPSPTAP
jgi:transcription elongation GreA/GreB family factor